MFLPMHSNSSSAAARSTSVPKHCPMLKHSQPDLPEMQSEQETASNSTQSEKRTQARVWRWGGKKAISELLKA